VNRGPATYGWPTTQQLRGEKCIYVTNNIDLSAAKPQRLTQELANDAALLITMGCGDKCPYVPGLRRDDWPLPDPKGRPMDEVRAVRDNIKVRVAGLIPL
jgi:arsenate reductase (thioredoxin)